MTTVDRSPGSPSAGRRLPRRIAAIGAAIGASHVRIWLALVVATVVVGTAGYVAIVGWSFGDALYMTVITLTTVGFKEVHSLDAMAGGRLWTMVVAIAGVAIIFGSVGIVAETVLAEVSSGRREARRMDEAVAGLRDHYIVCGYGRVGSTVARELDHFGQRLVVIDVREGSLATARAEGFLVVEGDATVDDTLRRAGVERARGLVTTIDSDANNVYVTLSARALSSGLFIVGRANAEGAQAKLLQAGADRVVSPYTMAGRRIAELASRPLVADFIDAALSHGELAFSMEELAVAEGGSLVGRTVGSLGEEGIHTLAIVRGDREYEPNPPPDRTLQPGDDLIVSGAAEPLQRLRAGS
jgi:voltage-gated potassium channel